MTMAPLATLSLGAAMLAADPPPPPPPAAPAASSLTLAQAEATALKHAPTLEQALGQLEAAEGRLGQARSGYLPQVNATGSYQRTTANFVARPGFAQMGVNTPPPSNGGWSAKTFNFWNFGA